MRYVKYVITNSFSSSDTWRSFTCRIHWRYGWNRIAVCIVLVSCIWRIPCRHAGGQSDCGVLLRRLVGVCITRVLDVPDCFRTRQPWAGHGIMWWFVHDVNTCGGRSDSFYGWRYEWSCCIHVGHVCLWPRRCDWWFDHRMSTVAQQGHESRYRRPEGADVSGALMGLWLLLYFVHLILF